MEKKRKGPKRIRSKRGEEVLAMRKWGKWGWTFQIAWVTLSAWSFFLVAPLFIANYIYILIATLAGGLLMLFFFRRQGNFSNSDWKMIQWTYFLLGASMGLFSIPAINYYGPCDPSVTVVLPIQKVFKTKKSSGLFAIVAFNNIEEDIYFNAKFEDQIYKARMVSLSVKKGALGYYIYADPKLIP